MALVVAVAPGAGAYSISTQVGGRFPLHAGAASKVLAAHLAPASRAALLAGSLAGATPNTITDPVALAAQLDLVREEGIATDRAEYIEGVHAIAVPVLGPEGACVAAVSVAFLAAEPAGQIAVIEAALRAAGRDLSGLLAQYPSSRTDGVL
jgi:DNA-binding IclR family transcriptional regulator